MSTPPRRDFVWSVSRDRTVTPERVATHVVDMELQRLVLSLDGDHDEDTLRRILRLTFLLHDNDVLRGAAL